MIIGEIWHQAKAKLGVRNSRKRDTRRRGYQGLSARAKVRQEYDRLLKEHLAPNPALLVGKRRATLES